MARIRGPAGQGRPRPAFAALITALVLFASAAWAGQPLTQRIAHDGQAYPQFFSIEQATDRQLYVGAQNAILRYDGQRWTRSTVPRPGPVRQLQRDARGRVWAGGSGWFGYVERRPDGLDQITDVSDQFDDVLSADRFADTWDIVESPEGLVFRSLRELFVVDPLTARRVGYFRHEGRFGAVFMFNEQLLVQRRDDGLYRLTEGRLQRFSDDPFFGQNMLIDAIELDSERFLAIDRRPGLVLVENGHHRDAPFHADAALYPRLQNLLRLSNGEIAIASDDGTLRIYDPTSGALRPIPLDTSFQSGLKPDLDGALLVLSDQAVTRLDWPPELEELTGDSIGFRGVRKLIVDGNDLLAASYSGVFRAHRGSDGALSDFARLPGANQDVWNLLSDDGAYLFAEAHALYAYRDGQAVQIGPSDLYPREFQRSRFDPSRVWIGTEIGLALVEKKSDGWQLLAQHDDLNLRVTGIAELAAGSLLVSSADRGLWRIDIDPEHGQLQQARALGPADGLGQHEGGESHLIAHEGQWLASTPDGFYFWQGDRFSETALSGLTELKQAGATLRIVSDGNAGLLAYGYDTVYRRSAGGNWFLVPLEPSDGGVIDSILAEAEGGFVATSTALVRYRGTAIAERRKRGALLLARISVEVPGGPSQNMPLRSPMMLPAGMGRLQLELGLTDYGPGPPALFQVRMQGLTEGWSEWAPVSSFHYAELGHGRYRFEAHAQRGPGALFVLPELIIDILPHWYQRRWIQVLIATLFLLGLAQLMSVRHRRQMRAMDERHVELDTQVALRTEELAHANRLLRDLAELDGLTSVANRRRFDQVIGDWMGQSESYPLALLFVDVDHFKEYNDRNGHLAGDAVLRDVAQQLAEVAGISIVVARFGGEEFAVLCRGHAIESAVALAERLRARIADSGEGITVSIGVALLDVAPGQALPDDLIRRADAALYRAKAAGRNRVEVDAQQ